MESEIEKKFWYITRHAGHCATCKYYKPKNEIIGYSPWYVGICWLNPIPVDKNDAWKQKCSYYEEILKNNFIKSFGG